MTGLYSLVVDEATKRLIYLSSKYAKKEEDLDEILSIVEDKAPALLEGLSEINKKNIAKDLELRCYKYDEIVFRQNDPPDAYYTVIRGAVSLYALHSSKALIGGEDRGSDRSQYGKFLMQLPPGASFGELSFNASNHHSLRSAGAVSDGSYGQSRVQVEQQAYGLVKKVTKEVEASDVAVLLLVPEKCYMSEMFARHSARNQTKEKIEFLKALFLFKDWPMDQLVKMAYTMRKKRYEKGATLVRQGDRADFIWVIETGKLIISQHALVKSNLCSSTTFKQRHFSLALDDTSSGKAIDIAELGANDIFGLVELFGKSKRMKRNARVAQAMEVFAIPLPTFAEFMNQEPTTAALLERVVQKRNKWEALRKDYAVKFPTMPHTLPKETEYMSNYSLSRRSCLSEKQIKQRNGKSLPLFGQRDKLGLGFPSRQSLKEESSKDRDAS